jgi:hypothetical protein
MDTFALRKLGNFDDDSEESLLSGALEHVRYTLVGDILAVELYSSGNCERYTLCNGLKSDENCVWPQRMQLVKLSESSKIKSIYCERWGISDSVSHEFLFVETEKYKLVICGEWHRTRLVDSNVYLEEDGVRPFKSLSALVRAHEDEPDLQQFAVALLA